MTLTFAVGDALAAGADTRSSSDILLSLITTITRQTGCGGKTDAKKRCGNNEITVPRPAAMTDGRTNAQNLTPTAAPANCTTLS